MSAEVRIPAFLWNAGISPKTPAQSIRFNKPLSFNSASQREARYDSQSDTFFEIIRGTCRETQPHPADDSSLTPHLPPVLPEQKSHPTIPEFLTSSLKNQKINPKPPCRNLPDFLPSAPALTDPLHPPLVLRNTVHPRHIKKTGGWLLSYAGSQFLFLHSCPLSSEPEISPTSFPESASAQTSQNLPLPDLNKVFCIQISLQPQPCLMPARFCPYLQPGCKMPPSWCCWILLLFRQSRLFPHISIKYP